MSGRKPRLDRVDKALREVVADELELIDDDRLALLTVTGVKVDPDLRRATVWFASLTAAPDGDHEEELEGLGEHRARLQAAVARQLQLKRTPELRFVPDPARAAATRVEEILRTLAAGAPGTDQSVGGPPEPNGGGAGTDGGAEDPVSGDRASGVG